MPRRGLFYEYRRAADRHPRRVRFTHHGRITNGVGVCDIFGGIESVMLVRGPHPTAKGVLGEKVIKKNVLGSSFLVLRSRNLLRKGR